MRRRSPPPASTLTRPTGAPRAKRPAVFAALDHATVRATLLGKPLVFTTARGLFSADRVDDGTLLLLAHLPTGVPSDVLDVGCGYGALGLAIAAAHDDARITLVDRDLVAVAYAARNAEAMGLTGAHSRGGLGYRDLDAEARFDWVVCNIPARIGDAAIRYLIEQGARRLRPRGELRFVVIRDLGPVVARVAAETTLPVREIARSTRHCVFSCAPLDAEAVTRDAEGDEHEALYARDEVTLDGRVLERPHDLGEDAAHLRDALPLLIDLLPRQGAQTRALVLRGGYGAVALALAARGAHVVAADRDLLTTTFTRRNARRHALTLTTCEIAWLPDAAEPDTRFELVVAEVSDAVGPGATRRELTGVRKRLTPGGQALWLTRTKHVAELVGQLGEHVRPPRTLAARGAYTVLRDTP